jgi:glycosyltransferase involved in cell wall biosynthesis
VNILFLTLDYEPGLAGGAEHQARLQAEELVRRGHTVGVVCPRSSGQRTGLVRCVQVSRLRRSSRHRLRKVSYAIVLGCWLLIRGRQFDVWHVHLASRQADWVVLIAKMLSRPTYVKIASGGETGEIRAGDRSGWVTRRVGLRWAGRVQALSEEIADELRDVGVPKHRIVRIPNGLDLSVFGPVEPAQRRAIRHRLGLPLECPIILYAGRFVEYKGVGDLLEAWSAVASRVDGLLVLVGARGREDRPLVDPVRGSGVVTRAWTTAIVDYLHAADVFAYPPHQDGMSNALLEAMACGVAPVATRIRAVEELLDDGQNALLVPPSASTELATALLTLLRDDQLRRRLGDAAARTARGYSVEDVVSRIERTYAELTAC